MPVKSAINVSRT